MSRLIGKLFIIEPEPKATCELCGELDELRPYGPGGKRICFKCAMKPENRKTVERNFHARLSGKPPTNGGVH